MMDVTWEDLELIEPIIYASLKPFTRLSQPRKYFITNTVGNACFEKLDPDHVTIQHELSRGGRVVIDIKYEPDWTGEDFT